MKSKIFRNFLVSSYWLLVSLCFVSSGLELKPQWGPFGILVNDTPGNTTQQNPKMVEANAGSYLVVFEDFRSGHSDIYAQKIDSEGNLLLDEQGVPVCRALEDQNNEKIISDGAGGAIIIWQDNRNGNFDIYAQRIDQDGKSLWAENGFPVCEAPEGQFFPDVVSDGMGGAVVAWHDYRSGIEDIYAQRIDAEGRLLWLSEGVAICTAPGTQWFPRAVTDGAAGAIITWMDRRSGNFDVYAQRIDYSGKVLWQQDGQAVCKAAGNQENIDSAEDGLGGAIMVWRDARPEAPGIYLQKISGDGNPLLQSDGILLSSNSGLAGPPKVAANHKGGALVVWSDPRAGDPDIYMQFVNREGKLLWGSDAWPLLRITGAQENPKLFGHSPFFVVWEDKRKISKQLYGQQLSETGQLYFGAEGALLSNKGVEPQMGDAVLMSKEGIVFCSADKKKGNSDIYASRILKNGHIPWVAVINSTPGEVVQQNFSAIWTDGGVAFAWEDFRNGYSNIHLQKVSKLGRPLWGRDGVAAAPMPFNQKNPKLVSDGNGGAIVVWEDQREKTGSKIYAQKIDLGGRLAWDPDGVSLMPQATYFENTKPQIAADGSGGAIAVFCDYRGTLSYKDISAQRIDNDGKILWGGQGKVISAGNGNQDDPQIAPKSIVVVWTDYRNGDRNSDIYAQKLDLSGKTLWAEDGIPVCEAPDSQRDPLVSDDGEKGVFVAWTDKGGGSFDIFAQRLDYYGRALFAKDGIPVCQAARTQQLACLASLPESEAVLVWEDFRFGNWDIYYQKIKGNGQMLFGEEGVAVTSEIGTQYVPFLTQVSDKTLISWEDYRNGKNYNIYLQALSKDGKVLLGEGGKKIEETSLGARSPQLVVLPDRSFILGWEDYRYGRRAIYAQHFIF